MTDMPQGLTFLAINLNFSEGSVKEGVAYFRA